MAVGSFIFGGNPQRRENQASLEESQFRREEVGTPDDAFANRPFFQKTNPDLVSKDYEKEARYGNHRRPTSKVDADPFGFSSLAYPRNVTTNMQNGHYMLFYVNVQACQVIDQRQVE